MAVFGRPLLQVLQQGQGECSSFAGAGLCRAHDIGTPQDHGNGLGLNGCGVDKTKRIGGLCQRGQESKGEKRHAVLSARRRASGLQHGNIAECLGFGDVQLQLFQIQAQHLYDRQGQVMQGHRPQYSLVGDQPGQMHHGTQW